MSGNIVENRQPDRPLSSEMGWSGGSGAGCGSDIGEGFRQIIDACKYDPSLFINILSLGTIYQHSRDSTYYSTDRSFYLDVEVDNYTTVGRDQENRVGNNQTEVIGVDQALTVGNDQTEVIGVNQQVTVGNDQSEVIGHDQRLTVENDQFETVVRNQTEAVGADKSVTVGNDHTETVGRDQSVHIGRTQTETVAVDQHLTIGQDQTEDIGRDLTLTVGGDAVRTVKGTRTESVEENDVLTVLGARLETIRETLTRAVDIDVFETIGRNREAFIAEVDSLEAKRYVIKVVQDLHAEYGSIIEAVSGDVTRTAKTLTETITGVVQYTCDTFNVNADKILLKADKTEIWNPELKRTGNSRTIDWDDIYRATRYASYYMGRYLRSYNRTRYSRPTVTMSSQTLPPSAYVVVRSDDVGNIYLVPSSTNVRSVSHITSLPEDQYRTVEVSSENEDTELWLTGLPDGTYCAYAVNPHGTVSRRSSGLLTVDRDVIGIESIAITGSSVSPGSPLAAGDTATFAVTFTGNVEVTGTPTLTLNVGVATYSSGSGSSTLYFTYTAQAEDFTEAGIGIAPGTLTDIRPTTYGVDGVYIYNEVPNNSSYLVDA